ncbi:ComEA family DNA-binding protein [Candidatus Cardinium hertigii]|jgi:competence ComEA-like helix-hairpin-helix protein|uniref:Helix-hairpin-helix domain-containing protein n=1 Tax=Candidatus Cardinium hertigii TaxID=247481 RepID=A0A3N2QAZ9_9BACT|nr:helix-hairpin-helix domain-containing protein [Candidatus Cardinium hertigii]ROT46978.1 hypothetical protein EDM02_05385 [Candidatus Cardinium hertigii]
MFNKIKYRIKELFYFSNSESNGLLAIIVLIFLLIIAPKACMLYYSYSNKPLDHSSDMVLLEKKWLLLQENVSKTALININTTTVQQLANMDGITQKLATRIIKYRDKLGGFISLDQYKEVYGLSNRLQERLMNQTTILAKYRPKQLSLNHTTFQELVAHPYISPSIAKAIIDYRKKKGKFTTLYTIQELPGYHTDWANKIRPYLSL